MSTTSPGAQPSRIPANRNGEPMTMPGTLSVPGQPMAPGFPGGHPQGMQHPPGTDLLGAVLRRKFIVVLMALLGGGLGYLYFTKAPDVFESSLKLQITSQAPPSIVNGDMVLQRISAPRHQNLLSSELVLSSAVNDSSGALKQLKTLSEVESPVGLLKNALKVTSIKDSEDTMILSMTGPYSDELPMILNNVVSAYNDILEGDNRAVGQESIALIEKLQQRMLAEKNTAEERYLEIIKEIGAETGSDGQTLVNPHAAQLAELTTEQRNDELQLQDLLDRLAVVSRAIESGDELQIKVAAIEARKALGVEKYEQELESSIMSAAGLGTPGMGTDLREADHRLSQLSERYFNLQTELQSLRKILGSGHPSVDLVEQQMEYVQKEYDRIAAERNDLMVVKQGIDKKQAEALTAMEDKDLWDGKKKEAERHSINLYVTQMEADARRLNSAIERREGELKIVRQNALKISGDVVELNILQKQIEEKREAVRVILDRLSEINVLSSNYNMIKVRVLDSPGPGEKIAPSLPKSIGIGIILASMLGAGLALLIDHADLSFRNPHEIFERLGAPVLGRIPRVKIAGGKSRSLPTIITGHQANSGFTEAFRGARTALFFAASRDDMRTILCTSPSPGDGKSTTACNLALSMAQAGKRVLLIDADLRRPRVHQYMNVKQAPGLVEYLEGEATLDEVVRHLERENLYVITAGKRPKHPGELVAHPKMAELLAEMRDQYDFVIVDSPPVMPVADPCVLASRVDGVLLVLRIRKGVKVTSQRARESLMRAGAQLVGILVNGVDENPHYNEYGYYGGTYYGYSGGYYYGGKGYEQGYAEKTERVKG